MGQRLLNGIGSHEDSRPRKELRKVFLSLFLAALRRGSGVAELRALRPSGAVKLAADLSIAMAANGRRWSQSVILQSKKICPSLVEFISCCKSKSCNDFRLQNAARGLSRSTLLRKRKNLQSMAKNRPKSRGQRRLNDSCKRSVRRMVRAVLRSEEKKIRASKPKIARVEVLKSLVPGGAAMDTPLLLEEAFHYIEALRMQVESMSTLLHYFEDRGGIIHSSN